MKFIMTFSQNSTELTDRSIYQLNKNVVARGFNAFMLFKIMIT
jgi:hypothetical protein